MKSPDRDQWTVAFPSAAGTGVIAKIGIGKSAASIGSEYRTLERFADYRGGFSVPVPHTLVEEVNWSAFTMNRVHPVLKAPKFDLDQAMRLAVGLSKFDGHGITHGDLAPWNIIDSYTTWLIDWERAKPLLPGADLAHYVLVSAVIARIIHVRDIPRYLGPGSPILQAYTEASGLEHAGVKEGIAAESEAFGRRHPENAALRLMLDRIRE